MATESNLHPGGLPDNTRDLLARLAAAGVEPVRHGTFLGFRHVTRLTPELWAAARRQEPHLLCVLPSSPTPFAVRQGRCGR